MTTQQISRHDSVLVDLLKGPSTALLLGVSIGDLKVLAGKGLIEFHGPVKNGKGRPAHAYALTPEGKKMAQRIRRRLAK